MMKKSLPLIVVLTLLLIISNLYWYQSRPEPTPLQSATGNAADYPFLSKRIFIENQNDILVNFQPLRKQLESKFAALPPGTEYSFYFEYLPSGTSIRIGDDNELIAASLIKVPLVMNLYKASELQKINLDQQVSITPQDLDKAYGSLWQKGPGAKISLRDAAKLMLTESDNTATHLVFRSMNGLLAEKEQSLAQLDIDQILKDGQAVINAKSYTSVLKSLYFASYVNRDHSQEILSYLTESKETRRLTAQLPGSVKVAHKNGVFNAKWAESDCGIVYATSRPYAICVMVGIPEQQSNTFISDISKIIYDYVVHYQ